MNVMERLLLRDILNARIKELESVQNYWTGKTPMRIIAEGTQELNDTKSLKKVLLGDDE